MFRKSGLCRNSATGLPFARDSSAVSQSNCSASLSIPVYLNTPEDPEIESSAIRYVPQPRRKNLIDMFAAVDLRLVASGHVHQRRDFTYRHIRHVWAPSAGFVISDAMQERIGIKEVGLVEYRFQSDSFEVRHVRAPGQTDVWLDSLFDKE